MLGTALTKRDRRRADAAPHRCKVRRLVHFSDLLVHTKNQTVVKKLVVLGERLNPVRVPVHHERSGCYVPPIAATTIQSALPSKGSLTWIKARKTSIL